MTLTYSSIAEADDTFCQNIIPIFFKLFWGVLITIIFMRHKRKPITLFGFILITIILGTKESRFINMLAWRFILSLIFPVFWVFSQWTYSLKIE